MIKQAILKIPFKEDLDKLEFKIPNNNFKIFSIPILRKLTKIYNKIKSINIIVIANNNKFFKFKILLIKIKTAIKINFTVKQIISQIISSFNPNFINIGKMIQFRINNPKFNKNNKNNYHFFRKIRKIKIKWMQIPKVQTIF